MGIQIAPSILSADFANLAQEARRISNADWLHVDVMDNHFVPNLTLGLPVVEALGKASDTPMDLHLMIEDPDRYIRDFAEAGASMISVHVEVLPHLHRTISHIKKLGAKAGVVLNPSTPVGSIGEIAADVDFVLVMSVNPGFGGQVFIPHSVNKIAAVRALLDRAGNRAPIEVDGGVDLATVESVVRAGAEWLVAGNAIFGIGDPEKAARALKDKAAVAANA